MKPLLIFFGIFTLLMGFVMAFLPDFILSLIAVRDNTLAALFLRLFGAMIFYNGVVFLGSRNTVDLRVLRSYCLGSILTDGFCAATIFIAARSGQIAGLAYPFAGVFALFAAIYLYALIRLPRD